MIKHRTLTAATAAVLCLTVHATAFAQEEGAQEVGTEAAPAAAGVEAQDAPPSADPPSAAPRARQAPVEEDEFKSFTLTANPLSFVVTRFSANLEYMIEQHHGLILVPSYWTMGTSSGSSDVSAESSFDYIGGELGYHYYSGKRGANGFFVGPSFVYMNMSVSGSATAGGETSSSTASSSVYGVAVDFGGQHVSKSGFTIGGGMGVMWLNATSEADGTDATIEVSGTLPRFLFTVGYSF